MIKARAIVDVEHVVPPGQSGLNRYRVEVWGDEPHDYVRSYSIQAKTDTAAAQESLLKFSDEIENLLKRKN